MKPSCTPLRLLFTLAALLFALTGEAQAKKVPKLFTFGDDFYDLGTPKAGMLQGASSDVKVGYHCQAFGLFWVNIFTWSGEFCLYEGSGLETKKYQPITESEAAEFLGVSKVGKPWNYSFPPGMLIIIGLVGLKVVPRLLAKRAAAKSVGGVRMAGSGSGAEPRWMPSQTPAAPPPMAGDDIPPPMPPPLPPEQRQ
jgi:hypothetical protein